jgi:hypothetical protein
MAQVFQNEGHINRRDLNGYPSIYGINLKANTPQMLAQKYGIADPFQMTQQQAAQVYKNEYWDKSGAANLPANLQTPYLDAYIRAPAMARAALARSQGDPTQFMNLTDAYFRRQSPSAGPAVTQAWQARDAINRQIATGGGAPPGTAPPGTAPPGTAPPGTAGSGATDTTGGEVGGQVPGAAPGTTYLTPPKQTAASQVTPMDPNERHYWAQQMAQTGVLPPGFTARDPQTVADRRAILAEVQQINGTRGLSGADAAIQQAWYKANQVKINALEKQFGTIQANELNARLNGENFMRVASQLTSGNGPLRFLNEAQQEALRQAGDPSIAAVDAAALPFVTDYAKVTGGSNTATDTATGHAMAIMKGAFAPLQKMAAFNVMKQDMDNRDASFQRVISQAYRDAGSLAPVLRTRGLPPGATYAGTSNGRRVIRMGNKLMVEQ